MNQVKPISPSNALFEQASPCLHLDDAEHLYEPNTVKPLHFHSGEMNQAIQVATAVQKEHLVRGSRIKYASVTMLAGAIEDWDNSTNRSNTRRNLQS